MNTELYKIMDAFIEDHATTSTDVINKISENDNSEDIFIVAAESCLYLKKLNFLADILSAFPDKVTQSLKNNVLRYAPFDLFIAQGFGSTATEIMDVIVSIAGAHIDIDQKITWLCEHVANENLSIVDDLNNAIISRSHKYNKIKYRKKITSLALKCMSEYDYIEMIQNPEYTLLCAYVVETLTIDNNSVDDAFDLLLQTVSINEYNNFSAILNKIHNILSDTQLLELFEGIIKRGSVPMLTKFQKRYKLYKMNELMQMVTVARRREYFKMIAIGGHLDLLKNMSIYWTDFVNKYADFDGMVFQATYHAHIDTVKYLCDVYPRTKLNHFYSIVLDAATRSCNKKMIDYAKEYTPVPTVSSTVSSKKTNGAHYSNVYVDGSADSDNNWRAKK